MITPRPRSSPVGRCIQNDVRILSPNTIVTGRSVDGTTHDEGIASPSMVRPASIVGPGTSEIRDREEGDATEQVFVVQEVIKRLEAVVDIGNHRVLRIEQTCMVIPTSDGTHEDLSVLLEWSRRGGGSNLDGFRDRRQLRSQSTRGKSNGGERGRPPNRIQGSSRVASFDSIGLDGPFEHVRVNLVLVTRLNTGVDSIHARGCTTNSRKRRGASKRPIGAVEGNGSNGIRRNPIARQQKTLSTGGNGGIDVARAGGDRRVRHHVHHFTGPPLYLIPRIWLGCLQ